MSLGDIMKKRFGIEVETKQDENSEALEEYWRKIKDYEKREPVRPSAGTIYNNLTSFSPDFIIDEDNEYFVKQLCLYLANDDRFIETKIVNKASLKKGLLILGQCGRGKSYVMYTLYKMFQKVKGFSFGFMSTNHIVNQFNNFGDIGIEKYKRNEWYFDDLGTEEVGSHYGKTDVMKSLIELRYDRYIREGMKTHISSNMLPSDIKERYGERIDSRIKEMFNIIVIGGNDRRE